MGKHSSNAAPAQTPAEMQAYSSAQPYLAEYNSGKLNPTTQMTVNLADTNQTGAAIQSFVNAGMLDSSAFATTVGKVSKATSSASMQAGAGSAIDLAKLSLTQAYLNEDLKIANDYMGISSGEASNLAADQMAQANMLQSALSASSQSFAAIGGALTPTGGDNPAGTDLSLSPDTQYNGPGSTLPNSDLDQLLND